MSLPSERTLIVMADDDEEDQMLVQDALEEAKLKNPIKFVGDGEELLDCLKGKGKFADSGETGLPGLILLDLNMPKMDGREALKEIKADPELKKVPVVVLTTSNADEDISITYHLGVNSYITKPVTFEELVDVMKKLGNYWFGTVKLPE